MHRLMPALAGLLLALPAAAQDRPRLEPARDVSVTYRLVGEQGSVALAWRAAGRQARLTNPDGSYLLLDLAANRAIMASDQHREFMALPAPPATDGIPGLLPPGARFTRQGSDRIAGQDCTVWAVAVEGTAGRACITADGVVLRSLGPGQGGGEAGLEATAVTYAAQPATAFAPPRGYRQVQPQPEQGGQPPRR